MQEFIIKECKTKGGMEVKPTKNMTLSLFGLEKDYEVRLSTPILIVVRTEHGEIIIHKTGTLLFKEEKDHTTIETMTKKIYQYKQ